MQHMTKQIQMQIHPYKLPLRLPLFLFLTVPLADPQSRTHHPRTRPLHRYPSHPSFNPSFLTNPHPQSILSLSSSRNMSQSPPKAALYTFGGSVWGSVRAYSSSFLPPLFLRLD